MFSAMTARREVELNLDTVIDRIRNEEKRHEYAMKDVTDITGAFFEVIRHGSIMERLEAEKEELIDELPIEKEAKY